MPSLGEHIPAELREVTVRALARDPAERFPDVESLRQALEAFLTHRPALTLTARGDVLLDTLLGSPVGEDDLDLEVRIDACRFAYQQALRLWPESPAARLGLARLCEWLLTATVIDRRLAFVAPLLAPAAMLPFVDVGHVFEWQGAYVLLGGNTLSLIWRRDARLARAGQARHGTARH